MAKTKKLTAAIDFQFGKDLIKMGQEFEAEAKDAENLVSRGMAHVKGKQPVKVNSGLKQPLRPHHDDVESKTIQDNLADQPETVAQAAPQPETEVNDNGTA